MARVLITGGTGFIGSHLARACVARGDQVSILARPGSDMGRLDDILHHVTLLHAPPQDAGSVAAALAQATPETIFHLGNTNRFAPDQPATAAMQSACALNLAPMLALLDAAARLRQPPMAFVRAGTIAEYGDAPIPYAEARRAAPRSAYGWAALAATQAMAAMAGSLPFATVTARLALTYGPAQSDDFLVPALIRNCLRGKASVVQRPEDRRDLVHVDDVVAGLLRIAEAPAAAGPVVNLASGQAPAMREVAGLIAGLTGARGLIACGAQQSPASELRAAPTLARHAFGWQARTTLQDGLAATVEWERRQMARGVTDTATRKVKAT